MRRRPDQKKKNPLSSSERGGNEGKAVIEARNPLAQAKAQPKTQSKAPALNKGTERLEVKHNPMAQARARAAEEKAERRKLDREKALRASEEATAAAKEAATEAAKKKSRAAQKKAAEDAESTAESQAAAAAAAEASQEAEEVALAAARVAEDAAEAAALATAAAAADEALAAARAAAEAKAEAEEAEEMVAPLEGGALPEAQTDDSVAVDVTAEGADGGKGAGWVRNMFKRLEKSSRSLIMPRENKAADTIGVRFFGNARFVKTDAAIKLREEENRKERLAALLAKGFVEKTSRSTGKTYYFEPATGKTLWSLPEMDHIPEQHIVETKEAEIPKGGVLSTIRRLGASFRGAIGGGSPGAQSKTGATEAARAEELARPAVAAAAAVQASTVVELPPGWSSRESKSTGKTMFFCAASGETAWDVESIPGMAELKAQRAVEAEAAAQDAHGTAGAQVPGLPPGWASRVSKSTGQILYFNSYTGENTWDIATIPGYRGV